MVSLPDRPPIDRVRPETGREVWWECLRCGRVRCEVAVRAPVCDVGHAPRTMLREWTAHDAR